MQESKQNVRENGLLKAAHKIGSRVFGSRVTLLLCITSPILEFVYFTFFKTVHRVMVNAFMKLFQS